MWIKDMGDIFTIEIGKCACICEFWIGIDGCGLD